MTRRNELLKALEATPRDLARILRGTDPSTRGTRPAPDQWSVSDVVNHLISVEARTLARLRRVAQEENPILPYLLPDPENHDLAASLDDLLTDFTGARAQTLAYLLPLPSGVWARPATFENGQRITFRYLVQLIVDHDTEHLYQLTSHPLISSSPIRIIKK